MTKGSRAEAPAGEDAGAAGGGHRPLIVAFTCNWCSYAGADFAGISRQQYPATVRLVRLMCSGRVHPSFVLSALEKGADGVLVTGCHPGDCHYNFGNYSAEVQVESARRLADLAGLSGDRIRLQWVSASEGAQFARTVDEFTRRVAELGQNPLRGEPAEASVIDMACSEASDMSEVVGPDDAPVPSEEGLAFLREAFDETAAYRCIECGKCTGICPVALRLPAFHPRWLVIKGLYGLDGELAYDHTIWACLECGLCLEACRMEVDLPDFIRRLRVLARSEGQGEVGTHGGLVHTFDRLCSHEATRPDMTSWAEDPRLAFDQASEDLFVSGYGGALESIVSDVEHDAGAPCRDAVRVLNKLGVRPRLFEEERPSGHDLYYTGESEAFERLARMNTAALRASGARRAVFACPETMHTYQDLYPRVTGEPLGVECVHIAQLLDEAIAEERATLRKLQEDSGRRAVAYHDSCRMGRALGLYDEPRRAIRDTGDRLVELEHNRGLADCCGVGAWQRCDPTSRQLRLSRLEEARAAGADRLVTPCSRCRLHMECQQCHDAVEADAPAGDIEIIDFATYVADRLVKL